MLLLDNRPGYISWGEFQEHQRILEANGAMRAGHTGGAAKAGGALLSGLLRCGRCGRQLFVQYSGTSGRVPRYGCQGGRAQRGSAACLSLGAWRVDQAVVDQVLEAIQPAGVEAALLALERQGDVQREKRAALTLALEKVQYEAGRARRQYEAVDPENRLVAGELEKRWNDSLVRVAELEQQVEAIHRQQSAVTPEQRTKLLELGRDLPAMWNHSAASPELQKRILRTVLREIVIDDREDGAVHVLVLHWHGGVHTELKIKRNRTGQHRRVAEVNVLELIGELSKVCTDATIAATLNRLGYHTGTGKTWRSHSVANVRYYHRLPNYAKGVDWLTVEQTAKTLEVSETVIRRLIKERVLPAQQAVALAPWIIARLDLELPTVQLAVTAVRKGRQPRKTSPDQSEFLWK